MSHIRKTLGVAKISLIIAQVEDLVGSGPVVVFAHHRDVQDAVAEALQESGVVRIAGGQAAEERQAAIDAFQAGEAQVAVCSIQAAGVGITLSAASQVVIGEIPWTAASQSQAIDRVHRIGQDRSVTAWRILAAGTLDEKLAGAVAAKADISAQAIDGQESDPVQGGSPAQAMAEDLLTDVRKALPAARRARKAAVALAV